MGTERGEGAVSSSRQFVVPCGSHVTRSCDYHMTNGNGSYTYTCICIKSNTGEKLISASLNWGCTVHGVHCT